MNLKLRLMSKRRDFSLHDKMGGVSLLLFVYKNKTNSIFHISNPIEYMVTFIDVC